MSDNSIQKVFQLCSYLLSYPDQEYLNTYQDIENELNELTIPAVKKELKHFLNKALDLTLNELISTYVYTFDFGKKTNLYITYMTNGEQRERGMDLLFLKNYYKLNGFVLTDKELPDYLPVMLEFASLVDIDTLKPIFDRYLANIIEIADHLNPDNNLYAHIMKSIVLALEEAGIKKPVRRSEEMCLNNFYG